MQTSPNLLSSASLPFPSSDRKEKEKKTFWPDHPWNGRVTPLLNGQPLVPHKINPRRSAAKEKGEEKEEDAIRISFTPDDRRSLQTGKRK